LVAKKSTAATSPRDWFLIPWLPAHSEQSVRWSQKPRSGELPGELMAFWLLN